MAILAFKNMDESFDAPENKRPDRARTKNPVDLVHLSRQTLGERSLEVEVLSIFRNQSSLYIDRLENASTTQERRMAAHTILGSARGIGAWHVAQCAEEIQQFGGRPCDVSELKAAVEAVNAYIGDLLN